MQPSSTKSFSHHQAQALVKDLHQPKAWIFWTDFLVTILTGHALFHAVLYADRWLKVDNVSFWTIRVLLFAATAILFKRAAIFTHELVHLRKDKFRLFRFTWNLLCGIPFLIPSFMYYPHIDHHRRKSFGTEHDGEYMDLSNRSPWAILGFVGASFVIPLLAFFRFSVLTPIGWLIPAVRRWTYAHASTMVMDPTYIRPDPSPSTQRMMYFQEAACFLFCMGFALKGPLQGNWLDPLWLQGYLMGVAVVGLNAIRTLGSHRWTGDGEELSFEDQLLDSLNYPYRSWITELWGPVGTRYHAIHHLFPTIPYHNLGIAHRRLMEGLPADSLYRETVRVSLISEIVQLWKRASANRKRSISVPQTPTKPAPTKIAA